MTDNRSNTEAPCTHEKVDCFCLGAGPKITAMLSKFGPESAMQHFRNARVEILKGMRELIDRRIQELSEDQPKGTKVNVE